MRAIVLVALLTAFLMADGATMSPNIVSGGAGGSSLSRPEDPVVLTGADVPSMDGIMPQTLVAFRYEAGWIQVPVQVDERAIKTFATVYNGVIGSTVAKLFYTDPDTWTGADTVPALDVDDEIVFMAGDAGGQPPSFSQPSNTVADSGVEIEVTDPLNPSQQGWVYLFQSDGTLDPGAGATYVDYEFSLDSGDYKATYTLGDTHPGLAGNPEDSTITTSTYSYHFGDRWQEDEMRISAGAATNVDILDRHKAMFAPGNCGRTEDTFNGYIHTSPIEGAFVANTSGPVRAIRSYVGANSGPLTQRDHVFYAQRHDIRTALRVHAIPSVMDFFDYSPAAAGMTYFNDLNPAGVTIDGVPDALTAGPIQWQMVTGAQGTVVVASDTSTNIPAFAYTSYYLDDATPGGGAETQCTGDAFAYGSSGVFVNQAIPCTDPQLGCTNFLDTTATLYYAPPHQSVGRAIALAAQADAPLATAATPYLPPEVDTDADGVSDSIDNCPAISNPDQANSDAALGNGPTLSGDDMTRPNSDALGDACDPDIDNDGRLDADELAGIGCGGAITEVSSDNAYADGDPPSWDTDGDGVLDGAECALGTDPADGNEMPSAAACGGSGDSDGDGLQNSWETCKWGTSNSNSNSDADGLGDCVEVMDTNGNGMVTNADAVAVKQAAFSVITGDLAAMDINGNGALTNADAVFIQQAVFNVAPLDVCF